MAALGLADTLERPGHIENQLLASAATTYLIVFGTNVTGGYDDLDKRFDAWPRPAIVDLRDSWVGDLPFSPVKSGGTQSVAPEGQAMNARVQARSVCRRARL